MKKLLLMRHAKSSWDSPSLSDLERPLNNRGKKSASLMGRYIAKNNLTPDLVWCSAATRTVQTWNLLKKELKVEPAIAIKPALYELYGAREAIDLIATVEGDPASLMIIGHNPTLQDLTLELTKGTDNAHRQQVQRKFPTAGLAVIHVETDNWADIAKSACTLENFARPKHISL